MTDLAHKAVTLPRWRWMAGMADVLGWRVAYVHPDGDIDAIADGDDRITENCMHLMGDPPDLADPATLGCVLALVREAYGDPNAYVEQDATSAAVMANGQYVTSECASEAEALIAALEAAP